MFRTRVAVTETLSVDIQTPSTLTVRVNGTTGVFVPGTSVSVSVAGGVRCVGKILVKMLDPLVTKRVVVRGTSVSVSGGTRWVGKILVKMLEPLVITLVVRGTSVSVSVVGGVP